MEECKNCQSLSSRLKEAEEQMASDRGKFSGMKGYIKQLEEKLRKERGVSRASICVRQSDGCKGNDEPSTTPLSDLEQRLSQAEAEKDTWITQCAHHETQLIALNTRLSHLMDVAGKMAGALKIAISDDESLKNLMPYPRKEAKLALAEWDGIKDGGK